MFPMPRILHARLAHPATWLRVPTLNSFRPHQQLDATVHTLLHARANDSLALAPSRGGDQGRVPHAPLLAQAARLPPAPTPTPQEVFPRAPARRLLDVACPRSAQWPRAPARTLFQPGHQPHELLQFPCINAHLQVQRLRVRGARCAPLQSPRCVHDRPRHAPLFPRSDHAPTCLWLGQVPHARCWPHRLQSLR